MTRQLLKPYIFLSENYLKHAVDSNNDTIDAINILSSNLPYSLTLFFTDRYGNPINRKIDTLILQNTNIKKLTVSYLNNGGYTALFNISNNTASTVFLKAQNAVETSSLQIDIPSPDNPAEISGRFGVYGFICNLLALTDSNYKNEANAGGYRVVNGAYIHYFDYKKWSCKLKMENLPKEQFTLLSDQAQNLGEITAIPYQDLFIDAVYECAVNSEISYGLDRKTELFNLEMELNEL